MSYQLRKPEHEAYRKELLQRYRSSSCRCAEFCLRFSEKFSELSRVPGFYHHPSGYSLGMHWWLVDKDGNIIDPTADQFDCLDSGTYEAYDKFKHLTPKGKCMNCGTSLLSRVGSYPCSDSCASALSEQYGVRKSAGPFDEDMELTCDADIEIKYGLTLPAL